MLACLSEKPSARPTALQVLQALRASVEGGAPPPGSHAAAPNGSAGGADGCAADVGNPPSGSPLRAARAMSIQVQPSLPSPFAELPQPGA